MEWYEIHNFGQRIELIEQFFVEIAANEALLALNGFGGALTLPSAEKALEELTKFNSDFSTLKRYYRRNGSFSQ